MIFFFFFAPTPVPTRNMEKMKANILTPRGLPEQINTQDNAGSSENL